MRPQLTDEEAKALCAYFEQVASICSTPEHGTRGTGIYYIMNETYYQDDFGCLQPMSFSQLGSIGVYIHGSDAVHQSAESARKEFA